MQIIYVASPESQQIYVWKLDEYNGILKLIQVIFTYGQAQPIAIHPNKRFLYVGIRPNFGIVTYSINSLGLLKKVGDTKIFSSPTYLISDIQGTFLYCASYHNNTVSVLPICATGIPEKPIQMIENLLGCHSVKIDNCNKLLWVPCLKEDSIRLFNIGISGYLTVFHLQYIKININSGPRHIIFHNTNYFAYVINEFSGMINVINYDYSYMKEPKVVQTLCIISKSTFCNTQKYWSSDIHITPNGRWLYCSERYNSIISCFKISCANNQLKFINCQPTEVQPRGFAIDVTGKFLIVAGQKSHYISLYHINPYCGKLTILSRYRSGLGPMWVSILLK